MKTIFKPLILILLMVAMTSCSNSVNETDAYFESIPMIKEQTNGVLFHPNFDEHDWSYNIQDENNYLIEAKVSGTDELGTPVSMYYTIKMSYDPETEKWTGSDVKYSN
jgi:hypothetical protein